MLSCEGLKSEPTVIIFLLNLGSPDKKDLLTYKHNFNYILALTGKKCKSTAWGLVLSVLYQGIF